MPKGAPAGRPKVLVRRHVLEVKKETREWLSEELDELKQTFIIGKVSRSTGEIVKGIVGHPAGLAAGLAAIAIGAHTIPGIREIVVGIERQAAEAAGESVEVFVRQGLQGIAEGSVERSREEKSMYEGWVDAIWNAIKGAFQEA